MPFTYHFHLRVLARSAEKGSQASKVELVKCVCVWLLCIERNHWIYHRVCTVHWVEETHQKTQKGGSFAIFEPEL